MDILGRLHAAARRHPHADIAMAAVVWAVTLVTTASGHNGGQLDPSVGLTAGLACGVLVIRRRYPLLVLAVSTAAAESYLLHFQGHNGELVLAAPLIALYTVAETASRRTALAVGVLVVFGLAGLHIVMMPASPMGADNVALAALGGLAVAAGDASRTRRAYQVEVEGRARRAEAEREAEAARRVTEERLRIARDLHDVVGHQLALINVQAGVVDRIVGAGADPRVADPRVTDALAHIRAASRAALGELRETVGLLRQPGEPAAPVDPVVGLTGLPELLDTFRRSGLRITERVDGRPGPIPVAVYLTAFRVVQEALTNVCKHVGPAEVEVRLGYAADSLSIVVDDGGAGTAQPPRVSGPHGAGHGIPGMRERLGALGGELRAGPGPAGGFRVRAVIPLGADGAAG